MNITNVALTSAIAYAGAAALGMNPVAVAVSVAVTKIFDAIGSKLNFYISEKSRVALLHRSASAPPSKTNWHPISAAFLFSATLLGCYSGNYLNTVFKIGAVTLTEAFFAVKVSDIAFETVHRIYQRFSK